MAKLITFNKSKKIKYFGGCKIEFNGIEQFLNFKLVDEDETVLSIKFDYTFIKKQNFLCAFKNNDVFSILVIFGKVQTCETIYNGIIKSKKKNNQSQIIYGMDEAEIFKTAFFIPLIKEIQNGVSGYADLKMIVLGLVNSFENDEKILYLNLLAEILLIPTVIEKEETLGVRRKRPYCNVIKNDVERSSNISVNHLPSSSSTAATIPTNPLNPVTFDIVKYRENGTFNKRLLLFTSNERKQCYEYYFLHSRSSYRCIECKKEQHFVDIKYSVNDEGRKTFHFNTPQHHICEPFDYSPTNYGPSLIVKSPNFMLAEHKFAGRFFPKVIILDENDKNFKAELQYSKPIKVYYCNRCRKQNITFAARIINFEGNDAIEIGCSKHVCMNKI